MNTDGYDRYGCYTTFRSIQCGFSPPSPVAVTASEIASFRAQASVVVLVVLLVWESMQPFFPLFTGGDRTWRTRVTHGLRNFGYGLLNAVIIRFVFLALWIRVMTFTAEQSFGLVYWLPGPSWTSWVLVVVALDAASYVWHRASHQVPLLWRFHQLHHTDRHMDVTTANRFHLGEISLAAMYRVPVLWILGCQLEMLALYEVLFFAVVQFHHANIALPEQLDRALRAVIVTPHLHKVHHSVNYAEQNSNFSSLFSWCDRLARSLRTSPALDRITFGVDASPAGTRSPDVEQSERGRPT